MNKISTPYLEDIVKSVELIEEYVKNIENKDEFLNNPQLQDSVVRRLEIIGEATKRLEEKFKQMFPTIPWKRMAGMRDILIHDYDEIDLDLVWKVIKRDLPELKVSLSELFKTRS
ncbi:MAG: hypothetical protein COY81_01810 [Candidatus Pacebacteria bacterium CG_4_10_14_0_8_um_filter_43_12]|nr:MAG: hypothetical protein COU66_01370 [Candidatus Pacebacteria bacterium CG10_big_fil_rev_8_21_14_0_10_44_11]PIY79589.1 MAG: hypothetical protein COY81_01810 [Candidatus Pacebacteria bacterium CG_4_10_14_0_8_um_filter_43_12]